MNIFSQTRFLDFLHRTDFLEEIAARLSLWSLIKELMGDEIYL